MSFHAEKCSHLESEHEASTVPICSSSVHQFLICTTFVVVLQTFSTYFVHFILINYCCCFYTLACQTAADVYRYCTGLRPMTIIYLISSIFRLYIFASLHSSCFVKNILVFIVQFRRESCLHQTCTTVIQAYDMV